MSPEKFAELEKELYLNAITEQTKVRELSVPYVEAGLDGQAALIKANLDYIEKYPNQFAYDLELRATVTYERGKHEATISEAHERYNKYDYYFEGINKSCSDSSQEKELENE